MPFSRDNDAFDDDDLADSDLETELDRDFPLGDGTADTEATVACPYCGESVVIAIDPGSGASQEYVEDCQVCCQPWRVLVTYGADGAADVSASPLGE
jgi:cysteine-rich CPXCG protein